MANREANTLTFSAVGAGLSVSLAHGITLEDGTPVTPDLLGRQTNGLFTVTADATNVTVTNTGTAPADITVFAWRMHTILRQFGGTQNLDLPTKPFEIGGYTTPGTRQLPFFNVLDYGAVGNTATDDTAGFQAAIDAAALVRGVVVVPYTGGLYLWTSTVNMIDDNAHGNVRNVVLMGFQEGSSGNSQVQIRWRGPNNGIMLALYSRNCTIKNLSLTADDFNSGGIGLPMVGIDCTKAIGAGAGVCTQDRFENIAVMGRMTYHFRMSADIGAGQPVNCDFHSFVSVYCDGNFTGTITTTANIYVPNGTGQSKAWCFERCELAYASICIWQIRATWEWSGGSMHGATSTAIQVDAAGDRIFIHGMDSESCVRFLVDAATGNAPHGVTIQQCRLSPDQLHADGRYIVKNNGGPICIISTGFDTISAAVDSRFQIDLGIGAPGTMAVIFGCKFPNADPILLANVTRLWMFANIGYGDLGAGATVFDVREWVGGTDGSGGLPAFGARLQFMGVKSLGLGPAAGENLRGTVTVAGAATSANVAFGTAEPDTNYQVWLTPASETGAPAAGAYTPRPITAKAVGGFTVNLQAAPGVGTDITYNWLLIR